MPLGSKLTTSRGSQFTLNYIRKSSNNIFSWTANGNLTKLNRNGPWVVPYQNCSNGSDWLHKYVTVSKKGLQNAILKNLVWNYKTQSFHIWYIASSRGPLPKLFKLCPWGQNWPSPGGHNFTLNYMCPSLTFWVQMAIWAILRIGYRLKGNCLKIAVINIESKYSYYLCQYHHFKIHALNIINGVHVNNMAITVLSTNWWLF